MKTLKEVKAHVNKVGYNQLAIQKIEGFLLGNGLLGEEFEMEYMIGERDFDDFRNWFNSEDKNKPEIDWSEFGFGDFIHVQYGIDVVLLGGIHDKNIVCVNDRCEAKCFIVTDETRPCNEEEMESLIKALNEGGINFCFENNEFVRKINCYDCLGCDVKQGEDCYINEMHERYEELCKIAESMSEDNPFKSIAKSIVEGFGKMVDEVKKAYRDDSISIDILGFEAKDAIDNIIDHLHEGSMNEKEKNRVVNSLKLLVELGNMYE